MPGHGPAVQLTSYMLLLPTCMKTPSSGSDTEGLKMVIFMDSPSATLSQAPHRARPAYLGDKGAQRGAGSQQVVLRHKGQDMGVAANAEAPPAHNLLVLHSMRLLGCC